MPDLFPVLIPLVTLIGLGYLVGRVCKIDLQSVGALLIFVVGPIVSFGATAQLNFRKEYLLLPVFAFLVASLTGLASKGAGVLFLRQKNLGALLPEATGTCNWGFLGLPLVMALFPPEAVGAYFLITLGIQFFDSSFGYYYIARGNVSTREAVLKVLCLPTPYAIVGGLVFSIFHIELHPIFTYMYDASKGAYTLFGMMLVGLALSSYKKLEFHKDLFALTVLGRYGFWTALALLFIWTDHTFLHLFDIDIYRQFLLLGVLPVAAVLTAIAAQCDFKPQVAAPLVVMTVVLSLIIFPFVLPVIMAFQP
ncbi:MAG: hypothetical protein WC464_08070 [Bdellovibrionales bacterium]